MAPARVGVAAGSQDANSIRSDVADVDKVLGSDLFEQPSHARKALPPLGRAPRIDPKTAFKDTTVTSTDTAAAEKTKAELKTTTATTSATTATTVTSTKSEATTQTTEKPKSETPPPRETAPPLDTSPPSTNGLDLLTVVSVFRSGARSPFVPLPGSMEKWAPVPGLGRLMPIGERQMEELGRSLMDTYGDFVTGDNEYFSAANVYARATDHAWTLLSAQAVLKGMFPNRWLVEDEVPQVFPVHVNVDTDDLLLLSPRNCPVYSFALEKEVYRLDNPEWSRLVNETADLLNHFRSIFKGAIDPKYVDLKHWEMMFDPIECVRANKLKPPEKISVKQMDQVFDVADRLERLKYPKDMSGLLGGPLIDEILAIMRKSISASRLRTPPPFWERQPRLHLFAGHRETMSALLSVLGQKVQRAPLFGDHLEIELYRDTKAGGKLLVRVRHNSDGALQVCHNETVGDACVFEQFEREMGTMIAQDWGLSCQRVEKLHCLENQVNNPTDDGGMLGEHYIVSPVNGLWYVISLAAGMLVVGVGILVFWKWKHHAREDDVPEEIPLRAPRKPRGPKRFTLE